MRWKRKKKTKQNYVSITFCVEKFQRRKKDWGHAKNSRYEQELNMLQCRNGENLKYN